MFEYVFTNSAFTFLCGEKWKAWVICCMWMEESPMKCIWPKVQVAVIIPGTRIFTRNVQCQRCLFPAIHYLSTPSNHLQIYHQIHYEVSHVFGVHGTNQLTLSFSCPSSYYIPHPPLPFSPQFDPPIPVTPVQPKKYLLCFIFQEKSKSWPLVPLLYSHPPWLYGLLLDY